MWSSFGASDGRKKSRRSTADDNDPPLAHSRLRALLYIVPRTTPPSTGKAAPLVALAKDEQVQATMTFAPSSASRRPSEANPFGRTCDRGRFVLDIRLTRRTTRKQQPEARC